MTLELILRIFFKVDPNRFSTDILQRALRLHWFIEKAQEVLCSFLRSLLEFEVDLPHTRDGYYYSTHSCANVKSLLTDPTVTAIILTIISKLVSFLESAVG